MRVSRPHRCRPICDEPLLAANGAPYVDLAGQTISRFCDPRVTPPVLDRDVCCSIGSTATCKLPTSVGRCMTGMKFWCEYGTIQGSTVECFQHGPSTCAAGLCVDSLGPGTVFEDSSWICCDDEGNCTYVGESGDYPPAGAVCNGGLTVCSWGTSNEDGSIDCLD